MEGWNGEAIGRQDGEQTKNPVKNLVAACHTQGHCNGQIVAGRRAAAPFWCPAGLAGEKEEEMIQRNIRRVAAAAALATALSVVAPAQAASGHIVRGGPDWFKAAVHWVVANLLPPSWAKYIGGIDPDGLTSTSTPTPPLGGDRGQGIDPDG
jgi:hypothetical protein